MAQDFRQSAATLAVMFKGLHGQHVDVELTNGDRATGRLVDSDAHTK